MKISDLKKLKTRVCIHTRILVACLIVALIMIVVAVVAVEHPNLSLPSGAYYGVNQGVYTEKYNQAMFICTVTHCSLYYFTMTPITGVCSFNVTAGNGFNFSTFSCVCNQYGWITMANDESVSASQFYG
jgi:hypothetical protein